MTRPIRSRLLPALAGLLVAGAVATAASGQTSFARIAYSLVQDEGSNLPQQATVNFVGTGVTCADDAPHRRTTCTISGASGVTSLTGGGGITVSAGTGAVTLGSSAGGDASGALSSLSVTKLHGNACASTAPTLGHVLSWVSVNGSPAWQSTALGGDVAGSAASLTVGGLQGRAMSNAAPSTGQPLVYDGSQWAPATLSIAGGGTGATTAGGARTNLSAAEAGASTSSASASFTGATDYRPLTVRWHAPASAGAVVVSATAKGDPIPKARDGVQLDCARAVAVKLSNDWVSTDAVHVTIRGAVGLAGTYSASITIPANSAGDSTIEFDTAGANVYFQPYLSIIEIASLDAPAGWTAGTLQVVTSTRLGVPMPYDHWVSMTALWEYAGAAGAPMTGSSPGTLYNASGGAGTVPSYQPTTTPDGTKDIVLHVTYQDAPAGSVGSHAHVQQ